MQLVDGVQPPRFRVFEFWEHQPRHIDAVGLRRQPVAFRRPPLQMAHVLHGGFHDVDDDVVRERRRIQTAEQRLRPCVVHADACVKRLPRIVIGAVSRTEQQDGIVFDPAVHLLRQFMGVFVVARLPVGVDERRKMEAAVQLGVPFDGFRLAFVHGIAGPVDARPEIMDDFSKSLQ